MRNYQLRVCVLSGFFCVPNGTHGIKGNKNL